MVSHWRKNFPRAVAEDRDFTLGDGLTGTLLGLAAIRRLAADTMLDDIATRGIERLRKADPLAAAGVLSGRAGIALAAKAIGLGDNLTLLEPPASVFSNDWAEGAIGSAVAALHTGRMASEALAYFESLAAAPLAADDGFAFGAAGEADALLWAAGQTRQPQFYRLALQRMAEPAERARRSAPKLLGGNLADGLHMAGLLHGSAGVTYVLLRLAAPDCLPALATFELPPVRTRA